MIDHEFHRPLHHPGSSILGWACRSMPVSKTERPPFIHTWGKPGLWLRRLRTFLPFSWAFRPLAERLQLKPQLGWYLTQRHEGRQQQRPQFVPTLGATQWWLNRPSQKTWKSRRISPARIENIQNVWKIETPRTGKSQEPQWNKTKHKLEGRSCLWFHSSEQHSSFTRLAPLISRDPPNIRFYTSRPSLASLAYGPMSLPRPGPQNLQ